MLYGALELADRIHAAHAMPAAARLRRPSAAQTSRLRSSACRSPRSPTKAPSTTIRYTPKDFPWFYDKAEWTQYLDQLAEQRINTLYLWNGHPFTSLLKLPKYPEAQELPTAQLEQNIAMFRWLTAEADKRGIWILQGFYNIHLSHTFARAHDVPFHLSAPTPLASEYTRYCISEFIREYPNVGIFMTLGEAMGPHYGAEWLTEDHHPRREGWPRRRGESSRPSCPRAADRCARTRHRYRRRRWPPAKPLYSNIDTMWKWNGESLTWTNIRGRVRQKFQKLVADSNDTIVNIHLLSNLEPFRWGDPDFVRQTVLNFVRIGIGGVHVYPLRYWDWPYSADNTDAAAACRPTATGSGIQPGRAMPGTRSAIPRSSRPTGASSSHDASLFPAA